MKLQNNIFLLIILGIMLLNCQAKDEKKDLSIRIKHVDFELLTTVAVNCNEFENYFNNYKEIIIKDSAEIYDFLLLFDNLEKTDSTYSKIIDTRAKVEINCGADTSTICIGYLSLIKDGKQFKTPDSIIDFIESR